MINLDEIHDAYEKMKPLIIRRLKYIKPAWVDIEDVWQDVLLDGFTKVPDKYDPEKSSLTTFVVWVARSYISNLSKKWSRYKEVEASEEYEPEGNSIEDTANFKHIIYTLTEDLDPKKRLVVRYRYEGFTEEQIGKRFNFTKQRVNELFQRASEDIQDRFTLEEAYELTTANVRSE